jgi:hypothetical protein
MSDSPRKPGLSRNLISVIGAIIAFVALMNTIFLIVIDVRAAHSSPYLGILAWIVGPAILSFGLLVYLGGMLLERRRRRGKDPAEYSQYPKVDFNVRRTRRGLQEFPSRARRLRRLPRRIGRRLVCAVEIVGLLSALFRAVQ